MPNLRGPARVYHLILTGMPWIETWLAGYLRLYSPVGFVHHFRPLS